MYQYTFQQRSFNILLYDLHGFTFNPLFFGSKGRRPLN